MSPYLTACTGMDALVDAIEVYVSTANSPLYDLHALETVRLISANLLSVLFVDNEEILVDLGKEILESLGYAVTNYLSLRIQ